MYIRIFAVYGLDQRLRVCRNTYGRYRYDVNENYLIFKTLHHLSIKVQNISATLTLNFQLVNNSLPHPLHKIMEQQPYCPCERTKSKQKQNQVTSYSNRLRVLLFNLAQKQCNGIRDTVSRKISCH